ncbi:MAG: acetyl-CoA C-acetyltransferase [Pseudomonadota bacterium]
MRTAYIVGAARTPGGRRDGQLKDWHPADLGALVVDELVKRTGADPERIDDVIFGCVSQVGAQSGNIGRNVVLSSSLPESVPGTAVDRQCGSSQQAIHFGAQAVMSGTQDLVIAGGVENMSMVPIGASIVDGLKNDHGHPFQSKGMMDRYPGVQFSQFAGAEMIAKEWKMTREQLDEFGLASHQKAAHATNEGYFEREIVPVPIIWEDGSKKMAARDEGIRFDANIEGLSSLKILSEGGMLSAGTSSQICDGGAAIMMASEEAVKELGLTPRARVHTLALAGADPVMMLTGPIPATQKALDKAAMSIDDIDLYEVNEAFAPVPLAWAHDIKADLNKLNVNGGAMALGHPLGGTGAKLMTTLLHELERRGARYGLQAICEGGGTANAMIIERL